MTDKKSQKEKTEALYKSLENLKELFGDDQEDLFEEDLEEKIDTIEEYTPKKKNKNRLGERNKASIHYNKNDYSGIPYCTLHDPKDSELYWYNWADVIEFYPYFVSPRSYNFYYFIRKKREILKKIAEIKRVTYTPRHKL